MRVTTTLSLAAMLIAATVTAATPTDAPRITTEKATITATVVASGLDHPWGIAILPDGRMLITERSGRMRIFEQNGKPSKAITGLPKVDARDQGGLLDVAIDPDFARNGLVYWSYAEAGPGGNSTAVARGRLNAKKAKLDSVQVIFSQKPKVASTLHFGSRLVFDRTGALFITLGERFDYTIREKAQTLDSDIGKVVRITPEKDATWTAAGLAREQMAQLVGHLNQYLTGQRGFTARRIPEKTGYVSDYDGLSRHREWAFGGDDDAEDEE